MVNSFEPFRILVICTANVCRSPLAAHVLRSGLSPSQASNSTTGISGLVVDSAGIDVDPGDPMCPQSAARAGLDSPAHASASMTANALRLADLVLALDRTHRAAAARLAPDSRHKLFTLRQAAEIARLIANDSSRSRFPPGAPPLPAHPRERLRWLVAELDAGRGALAGLPEGSEDIPDNHGAKDHRATLDDVVAAASALGMALAELTSI